jgi:small-conductance mechanosensitive channel
MAVNYDGIFHLVLMGLTEHVFGNMILSVSVLMMFFIVVALLIQIPVPFAVAIPIPMAIVFVAYGYITHLVAGLMVIFFLVLAVSSFLAGLGIGN